MSNTSWLSPPEKGTSRSRATSADRQVMHTRIEDESSIEETYKLGKELGRGSFGVVIEAIHKETNKIWAVKIVNKEKAGSMNVKMLEREVAILKKVNHKHLIHLEEVFETPKRMYLVMELCDQGELQELFRAKELFSEQETRIVIGRLASAIANLHKNDIVHRDIKLENILISSNPENREDRLNIKITDFGLSVVKGGVGSDLQDFCGTPMYMAPEIIENHTYSQVCDVWSIGVIAFTLLCGQAPFLGATEDELYENIKKGELNFSLPRWKEISEAAQKCIRGMMKVDPAHRLTASEIVNHGWITGKGEDNPANVLELMKQWKDDLSIKQNGEDDNEDNNNERNRDIDKKQSADVQLSSSSSSSCSKSSTSQAGTETDKGKRNSSVVSKKSSVSKATTVSKPNVANGSNKKSSVSVDPKSPSSSSPMLGTKSRNSSGSKPPSSPKPSTRSKIKKN